MPVFLYFGSYFVNYRSSQAEILQKHVNIDLATLFCGF